MAAKVEVLVTATGQQEAAAKWEEMAAAIRKSEAAAQVE